jgi:hypothetical protein
MFDFIVESPTRNNVGNLGSAGFSTGDLESSTTGRGSSAAGRTPQAKIEKITATKNAIRMRNSFLVLAVAS